jgi:hypothetical protein
MAFSVSSLALGSATDQRRRSPQTLRQRVIDVSGVPVNVIHDHFLQIAVVHAGLPVLRSQWIVISARESL